MNAEPEVEAAALRRTFHERREAIQRQGKRVLLPPWARELAADDLRARPIILAGFGGLGAEYLAKLTACGFSVIALADDRRASEPGLSALADIPHLARRRPDAIVLNAIAHSHEAHRAVTLSCRERSIPCLTAYHLDAALRWAGCDDFQAVIEPNYFVDSMLDPAVDLDATAALLADEASRSVFWRVTLSRLTMCNQPYADAKAVSPRQYFPDFFDYGGEQILIDGGAFDGLDSESFISTIQPGATCHMFEIEPANIARCQVKARELAVRFPQSRPIAWSKGLWSHAQALVLSGDGPSARSLPDGAAAARAEVVGLDQVVEHATLIKLEVEGAERQALQGARQLIARCRPNLSVSVYHLADDLIHIPRQILEMDAGYALRLGHHTPWWSFTVLYAQARP